MEEREAKQFKWSNTLLLVVAFAAIIQTVIVARTLWRLGQWHSLYFEIAKLIVFVPVVVHFIRLSFQLANDTSLKPALRNLSWQAAAFILLISYGADSAISVLH